MKMRWSVVALASLLGLILIQPLLSARAERPGQIAPRPTTIVDRWLAEAPPAPPDVSAAGRSLPAMPQGDLAPWECLVFQTYDAGNWDLKVEGACSVPAGQLITTHPAIDSRPRVNRGATQVVFNSTRDGDYEIDVMNLDGSNLRQLTFNGADDYGPDWSPDDSRIVFASDRTGNWEIFSMNQDGSDQRQLTHHGSADDISPSWSPDGTRIAWIKAYNSYLGAVWVMNADGSNPHPLTQDLIFPENPVWSHSGAQVAFDYASACFSSYGCFTTIASINADGSGFHKFEGTGNYLRDGWMGSWARDDDALYFTWVEYRPDVNNQLYIDWSDLVRLALPYGSPNGPVIPFRSATYPRHPDAEVADLWPPQSAVRALPTFSPPTFEVSWSGTDRGVSGIATYDIQYRDGSGNNWISWLTGTTALSSTFTGLPGHHYDFRSHAQDRAGFVEAYPAGEGDASTTMYEVALPGTIFGNRDQPVAVARIQSQPAALAEGVSISSGRFELYYVLGGFYTLTVQRAGFGLLPAMHGVPAFPTPIPVALYLPPTDNVMLNGEFETGDLSHWTTSGSVPPFITTTAHTGGSAVQLAGSASRLEQTLTFSPTLPPSLTLSLMYQVITSNPLRDTLEVAFETSADTVTYTLPLTETGWKHRWWELPAWEVPTGTFRIELTAGEMAQPPNVVFDEISLGSAASGVYPVYLPVITR